MPPAEPSAGPPTGGDPLLALDGVSVCYGKVEALRGISLCLYDGEVVALIGGNGAGKTTALKTISGLLRPTAGTVTLAGRRIDRVAPHQIVTLGVSQAPEGRGIFPGMTVAENLAMGTYARRDKANYAADYERVYGLFPVLSDRRAQTAGTMSGGEQQMLAIGRALMARPRVLLLDEPSMGLAPLMVQQILAIIDEIHAQGTSILLVEQNAQAALRRAGRGYVLESGRIVLEAAADVLLGDEAVQRAYLGGDIAED